MDDTITAESLGYRVERHPGDDGQGGTLAYILTGPRGARYGLIRNVHQPYMLFVMNDRLGKVIKVKGWSWFRDDMGLPLRPVG